MVCVLSVDASCFSCDQPFLSCFLLCGQLQFLLRHPAAFLFPVFSYRLVAEACFVHPHPEVAENTDGVMGCREKFSVSGGYQNKKIRPGIRSGFSFIKINPGYQVYPALLFSAAF
jgi:hypothetical protein